MVGGERLWVCLFGAPVSRVWCLLKVLAELCSGANGSERSSLRK